MTCYFPIDPNEKQVKHEIKINIVKLKWYEKIFYRWKVRKVIRKLIRDMK
jgi:hypothetical protein